jgi:glycosyltransferase involved in cell wall biosynthesis
LTRFINKIIFLYFHPPVYYKRSYRSFCLPKIQFLRRCFCGGVLLFYFFLSKIYSFVFLFFIQFHSNLYFFRFDSSLVFFEQDCITDTNAYQGKQMSRQKDRHTNRQTDRQTDEQIFTEHFLDLHLQYASNMAMIYRFCI